MNKRMREPFYTLMWKASIGYNDGWSQIDPEVLEKFAELIVKECAQVLLANKTPLTKDYDDEWYAGYNCAMNNSIYYIHEHFGIEE